MDDADYINLFMKSFEYKNIIKKLLNKDIKFLGLKRILQLYFNNNITISVIVILLLP